jgi:REP element-mobilizing transposase RayT
VSEYLYKSHNVSVLIYTIVLAAKYRQTVLFKKIETGCVSIRKGMAAPYEVHFWEMGSDKCHVQSSPVYGATKWVTIIKSIRAKEIFKRCPG